MITRGISFSMARASMQKDISHSFVKMSAYSLCSDSIDFLFMGQMEIA